MDKPFAIRKGRRSMIHCSFIYNGDGRMGEGNLWDLSPSGWRSTNNDVLEPGTVMSAYIALPDRGESKYVVIESAIVRWSHGIEAGWEILKIDASARERIRTFLEQGVTPARSLNARSHAA